MTITLIVPEEPTPEEGVARILGMELPDQLSAGEQITGWIKLTNNGGADRLRLELTTEWNGNVYEVIEDVLPGQGWNISLSFIMPNQDAVMTFRAQHDENGTWVTDETASH